MPRHPTAAFPQVARRLAAMLVATSIAALSAPPPAHAAPIGVESSLDDPAVDHARVAGWLARDNLRAALVARGVDPVEADHRVAALTDAEARRLANGIDELAAGGDVLGVAFTVFVVLLITDVLGFTKVFPFTRSIR